MRMNLTSARPSLIASIQLESSVNVRIGRSGLGFQELLSLRPDDGIAVPKAVFRLGTTIIVPSLAWQSFTMYTTQVTRRSPIATPLAFEALMTGAALMCAWLPSLPSVERLFLVKRP